jgi:ATP-dependent RNA helicase RhlE
MTFSALGLSEPIVRAVSELGYAQPTPIQQQAIPVVLAGKDLLAAAQTGTGKTAGFVLPILQRLSNTAPAATQPSRARQPIRALILTPTRERAAQVEDSVKQYSRNLRISSLALFGGVSINPQIAKLRGRVDILVATPGRLLDHVGQRTIDLSAVEILVLDEADRMLDMGFIHDIRKVLALLPRQRQNLLFSATFSEDIRGLAKGLLNDPVSVEVAKRNAPAEAVAQSVILVNRDAKRELLAALIRDRAWYQVLVFTRTKHGANRLAEYLEKDGINALAIHGNKSQNARTRALAEFKDGTLQVLVATDIAARGIDIDELPHVVNFELPNVSEDYVHRIGRTGRAGASGEAVSLVCVDEFDFLKGIERLIGRTLERQTVPGFEPDLSVKPEPIIMGSGRRPGAPGRSQKPSRGGEPYRSGGPGGPRGHHKPGANGRGQSASPTGRAAAPTGRSSAPTAHTAAPTGRGMAPKSGSSYNGQSQAPRPASPAAQPARRDSAGGFGGFGRPPSGRR